MKTSTFLRIASVFTSLYFAGHTAGMPWTPGEGPADLAVIEAMKSNRFAAMGSSRTYWDFYFGFGVIISVLQLVQAVVLWQLGSLAKTDASRLRPIIASLFIAFIANAIIGWMYFFAVPVVMAVVIAICLALAFVSAGKRSA